MQGKYDKRASKDDIRPEHNNSNYLGSLVDTAAEWFRPYAKNFVVIGHGNHEMGIAKRHEFHLIPSLISQLNAGSIDHQIYYGGFSYWVIVSLPYLNQEGERMKSYSYIIHCDHGWGGGAQVTKDLIQHQRRAAYIQADIIATGHTHDFFVTENEILSVDVGTGAVVQRTQTHIKIPPYKDEYQDGFSGWHVETGKPPKPKGACAVEFFYSHHHGRPLYEARRVR